VLAASLHASQPPAPGLPARPPPLAWFPCMAGTRWVAPWPRSARSTLLSSSQVGLAAEATPTRPCQAGNPQPPVPVPFS
jgi:hypothetical protein